MEGTTRFRITTCSGLHLYCCFERHFFFRSAVHSELRLLESVTERQTESSLEGAKDTNNPEYAKVKKDCDTSDC